MWTARSGRRYLGEELSEPVPLVLLRLSRKCDVCRRPTWFARPRQRVKGRHPLCGATVYTDVLTPDAEQAVLRDIRARLPIAYISKGEPYGR